MTKEIFLNELANKLHQLPQKEVKQHLSYYEELLNDMLEDGISQEDAVAKLGNINEIAQEILCEQPISVLVKNRVRPKKGWTGPAIAVAVLGAPMWIPLVLSFIITAAAIAFSIVAIIFSIFLVAVSFALAGILILMRGISILFISTSYAVFAIGIGFLMLGLACLLTLAVEYASVGFYRGTQWLLRVSKNFLIVKEG